MCCVTPIACRSTDCATVYVRTWQVSAANLVVLAARKHAKEQTLNESEWVVDAGIIRAGSAVEGVSSMLTTELVRCFSFEQNRVVVAMLDASLLCMFRESDCLRFEVLRVIGPPTVPSGWCATPRACLASRRSREA